MTQGWWFESRLKSQYVSYVSVYYDVCLDRRIEFGQLGMAVTKCLEEFSPHLCDQIVMYVKQS